MYIYIYVFKFPLWQLTTTPRQTCLGRHVEGPCQVCGQLKLDQTLTKYDQVWTKYVKKQHKHFEFLQECRFLMTEKAMFHNIAKGL
jgi:hypothetical protein